MRGLARICPTQGPQWRNDHGAVCSSFTNEIDGMRDVITINEDGSLITRFKVMIRPLKAIELVHRPMFE